MRGVSWTPSGEAQIGRAPPILLRTPRRLARERGRGGGGSCLRLAVKSGSCSSLACARTTRASLLRSPPASDQAAGAPAAAVTSVPKSTASCPSEKQHQRKELSHRPGNSSAANREAAGGVNPEVISSPR